MLNTLNNPLLTLTALTCFILLAIASEPFGHGYTKHERAQMDALIAKVTAPRTAQEKLLYLYGEE